MDKFDGSVKVTPLDGTNYDNWKFRIEMLLTARKLFDYATGEIRLSDDASQEERATFKDKDNEARAIISMHVSDSQLVHVRHCKSAAEAWEALKNQFQRKSLVRRIDLRDKISFMRMKEGESALEFLDTICRLRDQLLEMGGTMQEDVFCEIVLGKLPPSYNSLRTTLDTIGEIDLSWEKVKSLILTVADRKVTGEGEMSENALAAGKINQNFRSRKFQGSIPKKCFNCGKSGHLIKDCWHNIQNHKGRNRDRSSNFHRRASSNNETLMVSEYALSAEVNNQSNWIIDSGATHHMSSSDSNMNQYVKFRNARTIYLANNQEIEAKGHGDIMVKCKLPNSDYKIIKFEKVLHVPEIKRDLISVPAITMNGGAVRFFGEKCEISTQQGLAATGHKEGNTFVLDAEKEIKNYIANVAVSTNKPSLKLWHLRLGHLGYDNVKIMNEKEMVKGMKVESFEVETNCEGCALGKQTRNPFSKNTKEPATEILDLVHSDVCGPIQITSDGGANYVLTFIDDKSRMTIVYFLKHKSEVLSKFKECIQLAENFTGNKLKCLKSDNGGEYTSRDFEQFCKQRGITHELTVPRTPQQNGIAERMNRTLFETARSMLCHAKMPLRFWADAVNTAAYLRNRSPTTALNGHTPYEIWFGKKPNVSHLRVFGCNGYVHIPKENRKKLDAKSKECILLGYADRCHGYRMYDPISRKIITSRDVKFNENNFQNKGNQPDRTESIDVYHNFQKDFDVLLPEVEGEAEKGHLEQHEEPPEHIQPVGENDNIRRSLREKRPPNRYGTWIEGDQAELEDLSNEDERDGANTALSEVSDILSQEPKSIKEAWQGEFANEWKRANSLRIILAIANAKDMEIHHMDVKTAFLNGNLTEEIYMKQPEGYINPEHPDYVCRLHKSLYGLKQSARCWNTVIDQYFKDKGYVQNQADLCVYVKNVIKGENKSTMIVFLHVDDIVLACNDQEMMKNEKKDMQKRFEMQDLGEASHILGIKISREREKRILRISQQNYLEKVLERFQMKDCKPVATPIEPDNKLTKLKEGEKVVNAMGYQAAIGSLTYAMTMTRPDLAASIGILGKFMSNPGTEHWTALKRVLRYIKGTLDVGLQFNGCSQESVDLIGYADADWAGDITERKSTSGYVFKVCGALVSWRSKRQEVIALSSTEAEYIALSFAAQELLWLKAFLTDLGYNQEENLLHEDNQGAIALTRNPENYSRTKHIDVRYHFIRNLIQKKQIKVDYCPTAEMLADLMTKGLHRLRFRELCKKLGIVEL